jgi:hypothetical protein
MTVLNEINYNNKLPCVIKSFLTFHILVHLSQTTNKKVFREEYCNEFDPLLILLSL